MPWTGRNLAEVSATSIDLPSLELCPSSTDEAIRLRDRVETLEQRVERLEGLIAAIGAVAQTARVISDDL